MQDNQSTTQEEKDCVIRRLPQTQAYEIWNDRLYLSAGFAATNEHDLLQDGITHVLNVARELKKQDFRRITVQHLPLYDSPDQELPLQEAADFIAQAILNDDDITNYKKIRDNKCLVHCNAGQSRSASIVIYFLMKYGGGAGEVSDTTSSAMSLQQAWEWTKARKPDIRPNFGFAAQLERAELVHTSSSSFDLIAYKADSILDILEGSGITKQEAMKAIQNANGNAEIALGSLLE